MDPGARRIWSKQDPTDAIISSCFVLVNNLVFQYNHTLLQMFLGDHTLEMMVVFDRITFLLVLANRLIPLHTDEIGRMTDILNRLSPGVDKPLQTPPLSVQELSARRA
jgi:hypothetical protein